MRGLISAVAVTVAILLQLAVVDRVPFPGGTGPDLVLLTVAALALATGPMAGSIIGFCAGLALDVAPPAGHLVGEDALVFCLVGYLCGVVAGRPSADGQEGEHSALFEIGLTAAGAACGEAMAAGLGVMLSDPRVTWAAVKHVLPVAVGYDLLLSPFTLFAAAALLRLAGAVAPRDTSVPGPARRAAWTPAPQAGSIRTVSGAGGTPRLRLAGQSGKSEGWFGAVHGGARSGAGRSGGGRSGAARSGAGRSGPGRSAIAGGREPRLRLGRGAAAGSAFTGSAPRGPARPSGAKVRFGARRGEGVVGGSGIGSSRFGIRGIRGIRGIGGIGGSGLGLGASKLVGSRLGTSLLGGSVFSRPGRRLGGGASLSGQSGSLAGRTGPLSGRSGLRPGRSAFRSGRDAFRSGRGATVGRAKVGGTAARAGIGSGAHQPRFRKASVLSRLARGLHRPDRRKSPGRGWLRGSAPGSGRAMLGGGRTSFGGGRGPRLRSPGTGWLGRQRGGLGGGSRGGLGGRRRGGLGGASPRIGGRSARLGGRPAKLGKSRRRPGGLR